MGGEEADGFPEAPTVSPTELPSHSGDRDLVNGSLMARHTNYFGFGILSDYYGRVRVLTWTILLFAIFTGLCAFAQGYTDLLIYRTVAGIGKPDRQVVEA